jgi:hypothetical protein
MKSKLDLVKEKIIQFIQVRWDCQVCALGVLGIINVSPPITVLVTVRRRQGSFALKNPLKSQFQESSPLPVRKSLVLPPITGAALHWILLSHTRVG